MIIITQTYYRYSAHECGSFDYFDFIAPGRQYSLDHCLSVQNKNSDVESVCNGKSFCATKFRGARHRKGFNSNCNFDSNLINIYYRCIPNGKFLIDFLN